MMDDFLATMRDNWGMKKRRICTKAHKFSKAGRKNKMAVEKDIIKLATHIKNSYGNLIKRLESDNNKHEAYAILSHSLVTHIMLLVRRRLLDFKHANINY
jgi:hypothetical protein